MEDCTIGTETKKGVVDDTGSELMINEGGDDNQRSLRVVFAGNAFATLPASGKRATCRGKTWQITTVDDSPGCLTIDMIEPERRG